MKLSVADYAAAAALSPPLDPALNLFSYAHPGADVPTDYARWLAGDLYQYYLVAAYQQMDLGDWEQAVAAFRLALAHGAGQMGAVDQQSYFVAVAHSQAAAGDRARAAYLAGKYFARAGEAQSAGRWLERARQAADWDDLSAEEQAYTWIYLGRLHEGEGELAEARAAYETAAALAPEVREGHIYLLALLREGGDESELGRAAAQLAALGPAYRLRQVTDGATADSPALLPDGRSLIGYDLDEESLNAGGPLELWLWWHLAAGEAAAAEWLPAGDYWLERQETVNLAANPGFEWGLAADGQVPVGFTSKYDESGYTQRATGGLAIAVASKSSQQADHYLVLERRGIKTPVILLSLSSYYLIGSDLRHDGSGNAVGGLQCFPYWPDPQEHHYRPWHYHQEIGLPEGIAGQDAWTTTAEIREIQPPAFCQIYLEYLSGTGEFDNILFAAISLR
jgi:tetratricopeptide (TPR) repeat protein